ncbi:hypothetical protein NC652_007476 [Populus alba x Populus x berolinensis]|nr:hypothetical protein NC652_007476 [Populus alba x Populus x berolinensis]
MLAKPSHDFCNVLRINAGIVVSHVMVSSTEETIIVFYDPGGKKVTVGPRSPARCIKRQKEVIDRIHQRCIMLELPLQHSAILGFLLLLLLMDGWLDRFV